MHSKLLLIALALAAFIMLRNSEKEGWRPFAWYGYPGVKKGSLGYQARGDWCGVDPATRQVDKPIYPMIPVQGCSRRPASTPCGMSR